MTYKTYILTIIGCILASIGTQNIYWAYKPIECDKFQIVDKYLKENTIYDNVIDSIFIVKNNIGQFKFPIKSKTYEEYNVLDSIKFKQKEYTYIDLYIASQNDTTKYELAKLNPKPLVATHSTLLISIVSFFGFINLLFYPAILIAVIVTSYQVYFEIDDNIITVHYLFLGFPIFVNIIFCLLL